MSAMMKYVHDSFSLNQLLLLRIKPHSSNYNGTFLSAYYSTCHRIFSHMYVWSECLSTYFHTY
jgi:hypothetical protein